MDSVLVQAEQDGKLWEKTADEASVHIQAGYTITSAAEYTAATEVLLEVKGMVKALDARRMELARPLLDAKSQVDAYFKPALSKLSAMEINLKSMVGRYNLAQQEEQRRLATQVAETAPTREAYTAGLQAVADVAVPKVAGISTRETWEVSVEDESKVTREFCSPDLQKARAAVAAGRRSIPGFRIVKGTSVTVRAGG